MNIYEIHEWIDKCESPDPKVRAEAEAIVLNWNNDIKPDQMWRMKDQDDAFCKILSIDKKIKVEVESYSETKGLTKRTVYFGKKSFLNKWERMY